MTIASTTNRWAFNGNASTTVFAYTSKIIATSDLKVYLAGVLQTETTHYSVTGTGVDTGGNVTFVTAPPSATGNVVIVRDAPTTQSTALPLGGAFPSTSVEDAVDKLTILIQQAEDLLGRTIRQDDQDTAAIGVLPVKATRASKALLFDASGDPTAGSAVDGTVVTTQGDIITADSAGAAQRVAVGAANTVVSSDGTDTIFQTLATVGAAASGANSDITSLTGLTTPLTVAQGGVGVGTLTDGGILLGSGTGAVTATAVLADGEMVVGDGTTDPVLESGATLRTSVGVGTGDSPQFTGIELGHATDTTIVRSGAGDVTIEGNAVYRAGGTDVPVTDGGTGASVAATALTNLGGIGAATTDTLTNKTIDANGTGNAISNIDVADLANGTDGELITWSATGAPATVAVGTVGQVLTSGGVGVAPTFQSAAAGGGKLLQVVSNQISAVATGSTKIAHDDTIPQNTEGDEYMTLAITPGNTNNILIIDIKVFGAVNSADPVTMALFQDTTADALAAISVLPTNSAYTQPWILRHKMTSGTASSTTFKTRIGPALGTFTINGNSGLRRFGGVAASSMTIWEIEV